MKTRSLLGVICLVSLLCNPGWDSVQAATQTAPQPAKPGPASQTQTKTKQASGPFHGRLKSVDLGARSIVMGTRTFHVTADTRIIRGDKTAALKDAVIGENVSGYFKTAEDGKLILSSLRLGPKPADSAPKAKGDSQAQ